MDDRECAVPVVCRTQSFHLTSRSPVDGESLILISTQRTKFRNGPLCECPGSTPRDPFHVACATKLKSPFIRSTGQLFFFGRQSFPLFYKAYENPTPNRSSLDVDHSPGSFRVPFQKDDTRYGAHFCLGLGVDPEQGPRVSVTGVQCTESAQTISPYEAS